MSLSDLDQLSCIKSPLHNSPIQLHYSPQPPTTPRMPPQTPLRTPKSVVRKAGVQSDARILGTPDYLAPELLLRRGTNIMKIKSFILIFLIVLWSP